MIQSFSIYSRLFPPYKSITKAWFCNSDLSFDNSRYHYNQCTSHKFKKSLNSWGIYRTLLLTRNCQWFPNKVLPAQYIKKRATNYKFRNNIGKTNNVGNTNSIRNTRHLTKGQFILTILEYGCHKILFLTWAHTFYVYDPRESQTRVKQPRGLGLGGRFVFTVMLNFIQHIITFFWRLRQSRLYMIMLLKKRASTISCGSQRLIPKF